MEILNRLTLLYLLLALNMTIFNHTSDTVPSSTGCCLRRRQTTTPTMIPMTKPISRVPPDAPAMIGMLTLELPCSDSKGIAYINAQ